jgi:hypothetical protein
MLYNRRISEAIGDASKTLQDAKTALIAIAVVAVTALVLSIVALSRSVHRDQPTV